MYTSVRLSGFSAKGSQCKPCQGQPKFENWPLGLPIGHQIMIIYHNKTRHSLKSVAVHKSFMYLPFECVSEGSFENILNFHNLPSWMDVLVILLMVHTVSAGRFESDYLKLYHKFYTK